MSISQYTNSDLISPNNGYLRFDFAILDNENNNTNNLLTGVSSKRCD